MEDYYCNAISTSQQQTSSGIPYPLSSYLSFDSLSPKHAAYSLSLSQEQEPRSLAEANKHTCWKEAMAAEIRAAKIGYLAQPSTDRAGSGPKVHEIEISP